MEYAVELNDVKFAYTASVPVLDIPTLRINAGDKAFVFGPSGSGKTTLLGLLAGILQADTGSVRVLGQDLTRLSGAARDAFRGAHIGYIFQMFNLIPYLSVIDNIMLSCQVNKRQRQRLGAVPVREAAQQLADRLGIGDLTTTSVLKLSVGQQQRVAVARALLGAPEIIIADEPTSALDTDHREQFLTLLFESCARTGATLIFVSHDRGLMPLFDRSIALTEINTIRLAPTL
jgi:putative ABC transport system ATP-binding protein